MNPFLIQLESHFLKLAVVIDVQKMNETKSLQSIEYRESVLISKGRLPCGVVSKILAIACWLSHVR